MKSSILISSSILVATVALALAACSKPSEGTPPAPAGSAAPASPGGIAVRVDEKGFTPAHVNAEKGKPITLVFTRTTDATCATEVVFPDFKITKPLPRDTPVRVELPASEARTLTFQCGMGMMRGAVVV